MSYNTAIPQLTDSRAQSQKQLLANFNAISNIWANNHYPLNGKNNEFFGMHTVLNLRPQGADPETNVGQVALYNKLVGGIPQLFFMPENQHIPTQNPIQLTYESLDTDSGNMQQYSFVAGPFIVHMGYIQNNAGVPNGHLVTLTPGTSLLYASISASSVLLIDEKITGNVFVYTTNVNVPANSFTINHIIQPNDKIKVVYYLAIGI